MKKAYKIYISGMCLIAAFALNSCGKDGAGEAGLKELSVNKMAWEADQETGTEEETKAMTAFAETEGNILAGEEMPSTVTVYVCGQVLKPGVYELTEGARIVDALIAAGGFTEEAADNYLNQAGLLEDGGMIYVPSAKELEDGVRLLEQRDDGTSSGASESGLININKADKTQLMTISGVGEAKAEKIIAYREEVGGFKAIEDIMNIPGIKEGMFSKIKDQICVK